MTDSRVPRVPFSGCRVLLGVTGGIAAFKSITLARELTLAGAEVDVCLTRAALEFVQPLSFEALTGRPVYQNLYTSEDPLLHIRLAREADLVLIAPATANLIAQASAGIASDLLTTTLLATRAPVVLCPGMNDRMYAHPLTQANIDRLSLAGYRLAGPAEGLLAWGEGKGEGRMLEPNEIMDHAARALTGKTELEGKVVLVTAGPTREPIDPVRFIGNRSSGKMGYALAAKAWEMGAEVTLVTGPTTLGHPTGAHVIEVETAEQMKQAVGSRICQADVLLMAAAVADFRPATAAAEKIKKSSGDLATIALEQTSDILRDTVENRPPHLVTVGFALETQDPVGYGRKKLEEKRLDLLVVNDATEPGAGFEVDTNRVTILDAAGEAEDLPLLSKLDTAARIMERVRAILRARE